MKQRCSNDGLVAAAAPAARCLPCSHPSVTDQRPTLHLHLSISARPAHTTTTVLYGRQRAFAGRRVCLTAGPTPRSRGGVGRTSTAGNIRRTSRCQTDRRPLSCPFLANVL